MRLGWNIFLTERAAGVLGEPLQCSPIFRNIEYLSAYLLPLTRKWLRSNQITSRSAISEDLGFART